MTFTTVFIIIAFVCLCLAAVRIGESWPVNLQAAGLAILTAIYCVSRLP